MKFRDRLFGVPFSRLEEKALPVLTLDTPEVLLTLEGVRAYSDSEAARGFIQDISYGIDVLETIENAPWKGRALLRDVIQANENFDLSFRVRSDHAITVHFVIREEGDRENCLRLLRKAVSDVFSTSAVDFQRIRGLPPDQIT